MRWPRYASYILLKFYISKTNASETYVGVTFADEVRDHLASLRLWHNCEISRFSRKYCRIVKTFTVPIRHFSRISKIVLNNPRKKI